MINFYDALGLTKDASSQEIKKAYKKLAMKYHPDRTSGDKAKEETFKQIKEAYEVLSDATKRANYDRSRRPTFKYETDFKVDIDSFVNSRSRRKSPKIKKFTISLVEAYTGVTAIDNNRQFIVPQGIRSGSRLMVGKDIVEIHVKSHPKFLRSKDDLLVDITIDAIEAMTGIDATIKHLDGKSYKFKISAGIQQDQIIKLSGKGMPNPETDRYGDLLVRCHITIPILTRAQKDVILALRSRASVDI